MKFQIVLILAVVACAFANEVVEEPKLDAEVKDEEQVSLEKDSAEKSDESESAKEEMSEEGKISMEDQNDEPLKGPVIFEWTSLYGTHDIDIVVPVDVYWPSNWLDVVNALHSQGLHIVPQDPEYDSINLKFPL